MSPQSPPHHSPVRSLWSFTPGMGEEARQVMRDQLRRLLNAAVGQYSGQYAAPTSPDGGSDSHCNAEGVVEDSSAAGGIAEARGSPDPKDGVRRRRRPADGQDDGQENPKSEDEARSRHSDDTCFPQQQPQVHCKDTSLEQQQERLQVHYYQGLHDVASVLLMELGGEAAAFPLLSRLVVGHLRDCTRARCVNQYEGGCVPAAQLTADGLLDTLGTARGQGRQGGGKEKGLDAYLEKTSQFPGSLVTEPLSELLRQSEP